MKRRSFLGAVALGSTAGATALAAGHAATPAMPGGGDAARRYMVELLVRMASPVLGAMSQGQLHARFAPELSPTWDGRDRGVAYLEALARLLAGIAPWLALDDGSAMEERSRRPLCDQALASLVHAVDPDSADHLLWRGPAQALVDSAFLTNALLRAPATLWNPLPARTKSQFVDEIRYLRNVTPPYTNWLLFAAMNEAFLLSIGEQWDPLRIDLAIRKINEWYVGDGWYSDGPRFHFDYYGSYVIHPMLVEILEVLVASNARFNGFDPQALLDIAVRRMQRYGESLERMIGPDGSYPPIGRSLTYRTAVFQPLALLALRRKLPASLPEGQVRAATLAAQRAIFSAPGNFDAQGFMTLGFAGHQPDLADPYSNAGSMYLASVSLLALGLPHTDSYWTVPDSPWTMRRAYAGQSFSKDHYIDE